MKEFIKNFIGKAKCILYHIKDYGKSVYIGKNTRIIGGKNIILGNGVKIRPDNFINCNDDAILEICDNVDIGTRSRISSGKIVKIDKDVLTGPNVFISDQDHKYDNVELPISKQGVVIKDGNGIHIKEGSWIGTNCVIIGNIIIGKGSVVAANSVVTKNVPDFCVVAGVPAKIIKKYNQKTKNGLGYKNENINVS